VRHWRRIYVRVEGLGDGAHGATGGVGDVRKRQLIGKVFVDVVQRASQRAGRMADRSARVRSSA
jgi:hypothetical protein